MPLETRLLSCDRVSNLERFDALIKRFYPQEILIMSQAVKVPPAERNSAKILCNTVQKAPG